MTILIDLAHEVTLLRSGAECLPADLSSIETHIHELINYEALISTATSYPVIALMNHRSLQVSNAQKQVKHIAG